MVKEGSKTERKTGKHGISGLENVRNFSTQECLEKKKKKCLGRGYKADLQRNEKLQHKIQMKLLQKGSKSS